MAKRTAGSKVSKVTGNKTQLQKGSQQGHNTGKDAWKSNFYNFDTQAGTGQEGQRPRKGEKFGSTPGEERGHAGGKKGQAMGGKRGTMNSMKAKSKRAAKKG